MCHKRNLASCHLVTLTVPCCPHVSLNHTAQKHFPLFEWLLKQKHSIQFHALKCQIKTPTTWGWLCYKSQEKLSWSHQKCHKIPNFLSALWSFLLLTSSVLIETFLQSAFLKGSLFFFKHTQVHIKNKEKYCTDKTPSAPLGSRALFPNHQFKKSQWLCWVLKSEQVSQSDSIPRFQVRRNSPLWHDCDCVSGRGHGAHN